MTGEQWRDPRGEGGFTLVELMVTMTLLALVLGIATTVMIATQRTASSTLQRQTDLGQARVAVSVVGSDLRTLTGTLGVIFVQASPTQVQFFANRDRPDGAGPDRIRIALEGGNLVRYSTPAPAGGGASPLPSSYPVAETDRVLARGLVPGQTVFRYRTTFDPLVAPLTPPLTAAQQESVRFIEVDLRAEGDAAVTTTATTLNQTVRLPNMFRRDAGVG